jgi:hypothetical protein
MSIALTTGYKSETSSQYTAEALIAAVLLTLCFLTVMATISYPEIAEALALAG